jgi:hypothetical protein
MANDEAPCVKKYQANAAPKYGGQEHVVMHAHNKTQRPPCCKTRAYASVEEDVCVRKAGC